MKKYAKKSGAILLTLAVLFTSMVSAINVSAASFPYNATYPYGISSAADSQEDARKTLTAEWESWKQTYVTSSGAKGFKRVQRDAGSSFDTVSEGLGYGLILSVYFDEQALFDDLFKYVKSCYNSRGLMGWQIDANGNFVGTGGRDCASDADEDIALALVFASKKWSPSSVNYTQEAKSLITNLYNYCVESGTNVFKPGDTWGGSSVTNPSYFSPAWYKVFAQFTGDNRWNQVADKCYEIVDKVNNNGTGLVPDWCTAQGTNTGRNGFDFKYDAVRYGWRTAIDYSWFGDARAKKNMDKLNAFYKQQGISNVIDGYTIQGGKLGQWHNATFSSCPGAGFMVGPDVDSAKAWYKDVVKVKDGGSYHYFGNTLRMIALLYMTGNFPNPLAEATPTSPTPSQPQNSNQPVLKGDINFDGRVNAGDYTLLRRYILNPFQVTPEELDAMDLNSDGRVNAGDYTLLRREILGN